MKSITQLAVIGLTGIALTGCFDGSSSSDNQDDGGGEMTRDFTAFVIDEIENTDDSRDPVNVNNLEFSFNDQNNEQAFDRLF